MEKLSAEVQRGGGGGMLRAVFCHNQLKSRRQPENKEKTQNQYRASLKKKYF
jgi:hypothetical protein